MSPSTTHEGALEERIEDLVRQLELARQREADATKQIETLDLRFVEATRTTQRILVLLKPRIEALAHEDQRAAVEAFTDLTQALTGHRPTLRVVAAGRVPPKLVLVRESAPSGPEGAA